MGGWRAFLTSRTIHPSSDMSGCNGLRSTTMRDEMPTPGGEMVNRCCAGEAWSEAPSCAEEKASKVSATCWKCIYSFQGVVVVERL